MKPHFIFPASPLNGRMIDEAFQDQAIALKNAGFDTSVVNSENGSVTGSHPKNSLPDGVTLVYRGWMMNVSEYQSYYDWMVVLQGTEPITTPAQYFATHWLPNWYPLLSKWTPNSEIFPNYFRTSEGTFDTLDADQPAAIADFIKQMLSIGWTKFQLKDYVKSLKTAGGSAITKPEEVEPVLENMRKYRGVIEGGIVVRQWEDFFTNSELRYFVINGKYYGQERSFDLRHMSLLEQVARVIPSPFYSVDIAQRTDGVARVIEIGDGQVSDLVGWTPERFAQVWKEATNG